MKKRNVLILVIAGLLVASSSRAEVNLRFSPADTTVNPGAISRLSVMIDNPDSNVRTIEVYVTYDTTVVASLSGGPGALYTDSGFFVFKGFENDVPGQWHGYAVVMGSEDFLEGPGELYYWEYQGLDDGTSAIIAVETYLAGGDGVYYSDVVLEATTITVADPLSAVEEVPAHRPEVKAWPNPFNPRTSLAVNLPEPGYARMSVYDLRGRELVVLHEGDMPSGSSTFIWDGRDHGGRPQPTGQYLFRLVTRKDAVITKATLLK